MLIYNQIIICQEIIGSQPSVLRTSGSVYIKNRFSACVVVQVPEGIMRKNILVTHNYYIYSMYARGAYT